MSQELPNRVRVATNEAEFSSLVDARGLDLQFGHESEEVEYERLDAKLAREIDAALQSHLGELCSEDTCYQIYDWWPNCTRFLELDSAIVTWPLLKLLQSLLKVEFAAWRINIHVYSPLNATGSRHAGGVNIYAEEFVIEQSLLRSVQDR